MEMKFYICEHCGNMVAMVRDSGVAIMCCGQRLTELVPGTTDAAVEKHVPVWEVRDNKVYVAMGATPHPMLPEHYIERIAVQTRLGNQRKVLQPGEEPKTRFALCEGDEVEAVYAYCNLHGLRKAQCRSRIDIKKRGHGIQAVTPLLYVPFRLSLVSCRLQTPR